MPHFSILFLKYSKNFITDEVLSLLIDHRPFTDSVLLKSYQLIIVNLIADQNW